MIIKNYLFNLMYQIISIILPIITIPYVSRILGVEGIGKYSLSSAYAQYFVLFGMIGLTMYCSREISYIRKDIDALSKVFWELNILRFITMGLSTVIYFVFFIFVIKVNDKLLYSIQTLILLSSLFDISWLFIGLENFKKVSIRNTAVKIIGVILIFILVKKKSQVWLYALILAGTQFVGQIIMWFDIPKDIQFIKPVKENIIKHLKFSIKLFIPQIAINIYTVLDKIMLGFFTNDVQVGLYDNAQRIIKISITIVTALSSVTIPRMIELYKENDLEKFSNTAYKSFSFVSFLAFPMSFGLVGICNTFIEWFYGMEFRDIKPMFYFGSWLMISLAWSSIVGTQVLLSIKRDNMFTIAVTTGSVINVILNLILIKDFQGIGTIISSLIAEFTGMTIMLYYTKDILNIKKLFKHIPKYFITSLLMFIIIWMLDFFTNKTILGTLIQVIIGGIFYLGTMTLIKDENMYYIINLVKNKFLNLNRD